MHSEIHAQSSIKKWGGQTSDYIHIHNWLDETKAWLPNMFHRLFRHHSEGIFECERLFGGSFINSDGKTVYTRYVCEEHIKEDCYGKIPTAKEWIDALQSGKTPMWMIRTLKIKD